ncbi:MAG: glycosyltransferase [Candidatus Diapherotrites archaeon]|nr:glycosyltransferase [Candidatus Diapherotrites archaeon]
MQKDFTVFEVGWEVSNKVGGIYAVLSTKAAESKNSLKNFFTIGPYFRRNAAIEFEEETPSKEFAQVFDYLKKTHGIICHSGHWLVPGRPKCLLVDPNDLKAKTNEIKREFWDLYKIDSLGSGDDYNEPIVWGKAVGLLLEQLIKEVFSKEHELKKCIVHCHEWLSGGTLLHLKHYLPEAKTIFTTHATMLGRCIAASGEPLHEEILSKLNTDETMPIDRAYRYGIQAKHLTEKACAKNATIFTTVSDSCANEAKYILGRKPDILTPNGLNVEKFYVMEELANLHVVYRNIIRRFLLDYFAPYYYINVEDSLFYFISGRYETRNKGIDLFIDALGLLNKELSSDQKSTTLFAFIFVPAPNRGKNIELLKHMALYERLEDEIEDEIRKIKNRLYYSISKGEPPTGNNLLDDEFLYKVKKMLFELKHENNELPPISVLEVDENDTILNLIKKNGLLNRETDKVKVLYYPTYLSTADGLIGLEYYQAVIGCHLGVFPSYYESWGYTPLETIALGLPTVTTDLSGFGQYIMKTVNSDIAKKAVKVIQRANVPYAQSLSELVSHLRYIYDLPKRNRGDLKIIAKQLSYDLSWQNLIENYLNAYELAAQR